MLFKSISERKSNLKICTVTLNTKKSNVCHCDYNTKQNAKLTSIFDFSTFYTKLSHKDLVKVLLDLIDFGFDGGSKKKN